MRGIDGSAGGSLSTGAPHAEVTGGALAANGVESIGAIGATLGIFAMAAGTGGGGGVAGGSKTDGAGIGGSGIAAGAGAGAGAGALVSGACPAPGLTMAPVRIRSS